jgi:hypothetical protein
MGTARTTAGSLQRVNSLSSSPSARPDRVTRERQYRGQQLPGFFDLSQALIQRLALPPRGEVAPDRLVLVEFVPGFIECIKYGVGLQIHVEELGFMEFLLGM